MRRREDRENNERRKKERREERTNKKRKTKEKTGEPRQAARRGRWARRPAEQFSRSQPEPPTNLAKPR